MLARRPMLSWGSVQNDSCEVQCPRRGNTPSTTAQGAGPGPPRATDVRATTAAEGTRPLVRHVAGRRSRHRPRRRVDHIDRCRFRPERAREPRRRDCRPGLATGRSRSRDRSGMDPEHRACGRLPGEAVRSGIRRVPPRGQLIVPHRRVGRHRLLRHEVRPVSGLLRAGPAAGPAAPPARKAPASSSAEQGPDPWCAVTPGAPRGHRGTCR